MADIEDSVDGELTGRLSQIQVLSGKLSQHNVLSGLLSGVGTLIGTITSPSDIDIDTYDGDYVVSADVNENTVLPTKRKMLTADITVKKIQYTETTNPAGGTTVYIG